MPSAPLHLDTPLARTAPDYSASGKPLWLKLDALQPSGSFKLRGVGRLCRHEVDKGAREIFCASGGNAGIAAAYAGRALGVPVTIVVPETTAADVRQTIAATGANVLVYGAVFDEANAHAVELARSR
ncbi:pyridoxal-phosphate dependent enzyme, partial [Rhizobium phaseoli]